MNSRGLNLYRGCTPVVDAQFDTDTDDSPTDVIVEALAEAAGVDPLELPPLYEFVDTDALDKMFQGHNGAEDAEATLSFTVDSWNVFVRADGRIRICDGTQPVGPAPVFESP